MSFYTQSPTEQHAHVLYARHVLKTSGKFASLKELAKALEVGYTSLSKYMGENPQYRSKAPDGMWERINEALDIGWAWRSKGAAVALATRQLQSGRLTWPAEIAAALERNLSRHLGAEFAPYPDPPETGSRTVALPADVESRLVSAIGQMLETLTYEEMLEWLD